MALARSSDCADILRGCALRLGSDGSRFHVLEPSEFPAGSEDVLGDFSNPVVPAGGEMLKLWSHRYVARAPLPGLGRTAIFKVCRLRNPFDWLRWRRYALREFGNMRRALALGMSLPRPIACFERRRLGAVVATGLVMEDLSGWTDLAALGARPGSSPLAAARLAIAPLRRMADLGVFHADARDENILLGPGGFAVIDWQHAAFHPPGAPWMLEHLAAYYIRKSPAADQQALLGEWSVELAGLSAGSPGARAFVARVRSLLAARPSTSARCSLRPGAGAGCR